GFIAVAPPASVHDFSFLAPCPSSGMIIHGSNDDIIPSASVDKLAEKISSQKNITLDYRLINGADHFFQDHMNTLDDYFGDYVDKSMTEEEVA
ncbi:MAG: alpha/beta hydrolase, partial [Rhodospirillales bacterium]